MNLVGYDAAALGNHEFDFGDDVLRARMNESKFPWLATNVTQADGKIFHTGSAFVMKEWGGLKFGFFGIVTPETVSLASPGKDTKFGPYIETATAAVKTLKDHHLAAVPETSANSPSRMLAVVDLPLPVEPTNATREPTGIERLTSWSTHSCWPG